MIKLLYKLIACHFVGDYVLQNDFLAQTKGNNWWHLIAHCILYTIPFAVMFGIDWRLVIILAIHIIVDAIKARWKRIGYLIDQLIHLATLGVYLII